MGAELIQYSMSDIEKMGNAIAGSNLFGIKTPQQAIALMLIAQAEGKHPATAAQEYHIILGKPALKADAMLARFQAAGGKVEWKELNDKVATGIFSHPSGGSVEITWTKEMADAAKLTGKDTWKQYPRQMLRSRVVSEGIRTVFPGIAIGVYTPEEVQDFDDKPKMKDITPPKEVKPEPEPVEKPDHDKIYNNIKHAMKLAKNPEQLATLWGNRKEAIAFLPEDLKADLVRIKDELKALFDDSAEAA